MSENITFSHPSNAGGKNDTIPTTFYASTLTKHMNNFQLRCSKNTKSKTAIDKYELGILTTFLLLLQNFECTSNAIIGRQRLFSVFQTEELELHNPTKELTLVRRFVESTELGLHRTEGLLPPGRLCLFKSLSVNQRYTYLPRCVTAWLLCVPLWSWVLEGKSLHLPIE